jgi:hypothetical protein
MVAKITFPKRVLDALNYNEQKVQKGVAQCLGASGYLREAGDMNFYQKLEGLERRNELNNRATTKTLHVSLNFDPSEKLSQETLLRIASQYMERIGFGGQPFLVYRHQDAGHPHIHIVSSIIRGDGSRIPTHNLGRNGSEKARKELEVAFGLIRAEDQKKSLHSVLKPVPPVPIAYGKTETKRSIAHVVSTVFSSYAFTSLPEYNAVLRPFGVLADPGREGGRICRHRGLVYRILNEKGEKVGVPIKASSLAGGPTLANLERKFPANEIRRQMHKGALVQKMDACLDMAPSSLKDLVEALGQKGVFTLLRQNAEGRLYGITLVDHDSRCVFNGSDLGRGYSAAAIQARLTAALPPGGIGPRERGAASTPLQVDENQKASLQKEGPKPQPGKGLGEVLLASRQQAEYVPAALLKKKKRKGKRMI